LPLGEGGGNLDVDLLAGGQHDALPHPLGRFRQRDGERRLDVLAADVELLRLEAKAAATATATAAPAPPAASHAAARLLPQLLQELREAGGAGAAGRALGAPGEGLEIAARIAPLPEAAARALAAAEALEALEARLALGVDLAAVERLALIFLAQDLVGGIELG